MRCKVFNNRYGEQQMEKEINDWFEENKEKRIVSIFQQGGTCSGEDPGSWVEIITTIFYEEK